MIEPASPRTRSLSLRSLPVHVASEHHDSLPGARRRWPGIALGFAVVALLGACTTMSDIPPNTPLHEVEAQFGQPNYSCPTENGGQRLIWTQQPMGQYAWGANIDTSGVADKVVPLLTDEHFRVLGQGTWTPEQVRCEFGPPAEISTVGLPSSRQIVWSYRYRQNQAWNSLMYVYFGSDGTKVTRFHSGPDPMFDREMFWFF